MQRGSFCINNKLLNSVPKTLAKIKLFGIIIDSLATVAQLVEQLIRNQQVAGSSPASSSKKRRMVLAILLFLLLRRLEPSLCESEARRFAEGLPLAGNGKLRPVAAFFIFCIPHKYLMV